MPIDVSDYINLTEKQLDALAEISDAEIEKLKVSVNALWKSNVSPEFKDLLDAETIEELDAKEG